MVFFSDTNLPVAYTVIHDNWHECSKKFFQNSKEPIFWSNLVKSEYELKFSEISDEIGYFLDVVENILENNENDFDYFLEFENFIINQTRNVPLDSFKKHKILEHFWNDNVEVNIVHDELLNSFNDLTVILIKYTL